MDDISIYMLLWQYMENVLKIYKKKGETPLECIQNLKKNDENLNLLPMTYAGRLDPLAEGVLLVLVGDEVNKKDEYLKLPKEYEVDILFGLGTDTYDVMGKINGMKEDNFATSSYQFSGPRMREDEGPDHENWYEDFAHEIQKILTGFTGTIEQSYPPYSSRPVLGKPLFAWAREDKLSEIEIPKHKVLIENIEILNQSEINGRELLNKVIEDISLVNGDFRQKEIIALWKEKLIGRDDEKFPILKIRVSCGSGVYVRVLAHDIGEKLNIPALALNIKRTKVGEYGF